ncbi:MAG: DUF5685 family protein [Clostridia bacterium]
MFGYIFPEKAHLYMKDFDLYRNFYCGICKSMGRQFGQKSRFTINYDITFLTIVIHNFLGVDVEYETLKCVTKPFNSTRKTVAENELTDKMACLNVILTYYKLQDDCIDSKKSTRKIALSSIKNAKKKADKVLPNVSGIVEKRYENLRNLEKNNEIGVDKVSHEFASMMQEVVSEIVGEKMQDFFSKMCYNVGKWIYLIDALDDFEKDLSEKNYNLFALNNGDCVSLQELMQKHSEEIAFTFSTTINKIIECYENTKFSFNKDIIANVVYKGIPLMTKGIMQGEKCKTSYSKF